MMLDRGSDLVSEALTRRTAEAGVPLVIGGRSDGGFRAALGRSRGGALVLMRYPRDCEGSRTEMTCFDVAADAVRLPPGVVADIELVVMRLRRVMAHEAGMKARGLSPLDCDAASSRMNAVAAATLAGLGVSIREALDAAGWRPDTAGWSTTVDHPAFVEQARVTRHLDEIRLDNVAIALPGGRTLMMQDGEPGPDHDLAHIEIGFGQVPDAAIAALPGRPLSDLAALPGDAGRHATIVSADVATDGVILVTARCRSAAVP